MPLRAQEQRPQDRTLPLPDQFKLAPLGESIGDIAKQQGPLGKGGSPVVLVHLGIHVAIDHEQIEPAVVVEVDKAVAPATKGWWAAQGRCGSLHPYSSPLPSLWKSTL